MSARRRPPLVQVCAVVMMGASIDAAHAAPRPGAWISETPFPNPEFVAFNRYGVTGINDEGATLAVSGVGNGLIPFEARGEKASYRFTFMDSQTTRRARGIVLFYEATGTPKTNSLGIRLRENDAATGEPGTTLVSTVVTPIETAAGEPEWHSITLPAKAVLTSGQVYHVEMEMLKSPPGTFVFYVPRQRHPVPYMPFHAGSSAPKSPYDEELAVLVDREPAPGGCGYLLKQGLPSYVPVFMLLHSGVQGGGDLRLFGNPYDHKQAAPEAYTVHGSQTYGQRIEVSASISFNHVAFMAGQSEQAPERPNGDLLVEVYGPDCSGDPQLLAAAVLIEGIGGSSLTSATGRWHWYGAYLDAPVTFAAGTEYFLMLSSPGSGGPGTPQQPTPWDQWTLPADYSDYESPLPLPTFMGTDSYVVEATRSACTSASATVVLTEIEAVHDANADCAFVLSNIAATSGERPVNMQDETSGDSSSFGCQVVAAEGEAVGIYPVARNIGGSGDPGTLFVRLIEVQASTGEVVIDEIALQGKKNSSCTLCPYKPNSDISELWTGNCVCMPDPAVMYFTPFPTSTTHTFRRFYVEFGWEDPSGNKTIDDRVPFEVRKDTACPSCECKCQAP